MGQLLGNSALVLMLSMTLSCFKASTNNSGGSNQIEVPPGDLFALSEHAPTVSMDLVTSTSFTMYITGAEDFSGTVNLDVERDELDMDLNAGASVEITVTPPSLSLSNGETKSLTVQINVNDMAPSFLELTHSSGTGEGHFHIAGDSGGFQRESTIDFAINPVYTMSTMDDGSPHGWSHDRAVPLNFRPHAVGLLVRFNSMDATETIHRMHSAGPIPHSAGGGVDDMTLTNQYFYDNIVMAGAGITTANVYCHNHEAGGDAHQLNFNQPAP